MKIAQKAEGPKEMIVFLQYDSDLIALDVKKILSDKGYKIILSSEAGRRDVEIKTEFGNELYKNVPNSNYRYLLWIDYRISQERFVFLSASLRDRNTKQLLGIYKWEWNRLFPAPIIEEGIEMLDEKFLRHAFK